FRYPVQKRILIFDQSELPACLEQSDLRKTARPRWPRCDGNPVKCRLDGAVEARPEPPAKIGPVSLGVKRGPKSHLIHQHAGQLASTHGCRALQIQSPLPEQPALDWTKPLRVHPMRDHPESSRNLGQRDLPSKQILSPGTAQDPPGSRAVPES